MKADTPLTKMNLGPSFPIVGIGASAGGLDALQRFLSVLTSDFGFALVFIQHLSSKHKSLLSDLLSARWPSLVIQEISDGLKAQPGRLYLSPPGKEVRLRNGLFQTTVHPEGLIHLPIDEFLSSLAEDSADRSIAVIFSGAGTDGARGCQAVRSAGGMVFVQDPQTAEFNSMPLTAIATGQADAVLSPEGIAAELRKLSGIGQAAVSREYPISPEEFSAFFRMLQEKTGSRFNHYKKSVVSRRIRRRMYLHGLSTVKDYLDLITASDPEAARLASDLMIGVTSFFRDRVAWKALNLEAIRKITSEKADLPVRVWTPASATGEEAYSIAMMLLRELALAGKRRDIQVFATDVNDRALEHAREGKYPVSITADMPQEYGQKYFTSTDDGNFLVINKEVRECVVFAKQDLLTDPPFSKLDLIICRNFLIYLEPEAQEKCINLFHYALNEGGYVFLGNAETVGRKSALFKSIGHKQCRVYRKLATKPASRPPISIPYANERQVSSAKQAQMIEQTRSVMEIIQEKLLEGFGPAAVAINQNYEIIYHNGPTKRYLSQPRGAPTQNLLDLVPENLRSRIRGALYQSGREEKPVVIRTNIVGDDNQKRQISLQFTKAQENLYLVVFQEGGFTKQEVAEQIDVAVIEETAIHQLESELAATRTDLQSNIEQLKSMNEEFQSSNEELQASNEELETSREELQSLNEELITVNSQLQGKIEEQDTTNNDLNNFQASTNIPTIFLDTHFRVKRFTPAILKLIKLLPSDVGRHIIDMSQENLGPDLTSDAQSVLEQLTPSRRELELSGVWYVRTILPYRTADNRIEGVVVTYNDVTELKRAEERALHLASFPQLNPNPIIEVDASGKVIFANPGTESILQSLGMDKGEVTVFLPRDLDIILKDLEKNSESSISREISIKDRVFNENIQLITHFKVARIYAYDITKRKRAEEALQESEQRVRLKLNSILSPEGDIGNLELADIIDAPAIQSLMEKFYELTHIPLAVIDLKGKVLVGMGWQEICTKFHRVHPETCGYCIESDTLLTEGVPAGEYKLYKCKNNMWDVATTIEVGGKNLGHFFTGQFLFDGEAPDYEFFRAQAKQYSFDEQEYLAALDKVPRLSRATVDTVMGFFMKLSGMISQLSYSNIKLARSLVERDTLMDSLRQSQQQNEFLADIVRYAAQPFGQGFPDGRLGLVNKAFEQLTGYREDELKSMDWARVLTPPEWEEFERQKLEELQRTGKPVRYEKEYIRKDGTRVPIELLVHLVTGPDRTPLYYYSFLMDITERKRAQEERESMVEFLRLVNECRGTAELVRGAAEFFQQRSGCEAVGIRLHEKQDYPYFETRGFSHEFVQLESRLCSCDQEGNPILDSSGNPILACMCGNVICGRFDPAKPFFTKRGSFWSNCTTDLLATTTDADRQVRTRNRCNGEGYESVALIGLTLGEERLGLLQLNDKRKGRFTLATITLWERLADYLAVALAKFRADEELRKSEAQYRGLFENMIEGYAYCKMIFETGKPKDFIYLSVNRAFETLTGLENVVGKKVTEVIPGIREADPGLFEIYGRVSLTGKPERFEMFVEALKMWFSISVYSPEKEFFVAVFDVITERKKAEEAQGRLAAIIESAEDAIIGKDLNGIIETWNVGAENIFGYKAEEVIGKPISLLIPPGNTDEVPEILARIKRGEHIESFETVRMRKDGTIIPVSLTFSAIKDTTGHIIGASKIAHDITDRKRTEEALREREERLRRFYESSLIGVIYWNMDGVIMDANDQFLQMVGYTRQDLAAGRLDWINMTPPVYRHLDEQSAAELKAAGVNKKPIEKEYIRKDGTRIPIIVAGAMLDEARFNGVAFVLDITERKKAEEDVLKLSENMAARNVELEFANREMESFIYSVSHDLRAPLRTIAGFSKMLIEDCGNKLENQPKDYLRRITNASKKMGELIEDLLRLSRISKQDMNRMDYDLSMLISTIAAGLREADPGRKVEVAIAEGLRASVDPNLIRIAFANLLENAWKFTSKTKDARIEFSAFEQDGKTVYSVRDNGAGFDQTYADKMFHPFQRLHTEKEFEGTGVGLAIVERIIRRHGGAVWAEGEVGKGATVYFTLGV